MWCKKQWWKQQNSNLNVLLFHSSLVLWLYYQNVFSKEWADAFFSPETLTVFVSFAESKHNFSCVCHWPLTQLMMSNVAPSGFDLTQDLTRVISHLISKHGKGQKRSSSQHMNCCECAGMQCVCVCDHREMFVMSLY